MNSQQKFYKTVIKIAVPVTLQSLLQSSFSVIDQLMIGNLGSNSIAGVGLGGKFSSLYSVLLGALATTAGIMISQYMGQKDEKEVSRSFFAGLSVLPYLGWSFGTFLGAILGSVLPDRIMSALSLAIYGMFVAIVVPEMKKSRPVIVVVIIAAALSFLFYYVPALKGISSGITITVCAILAAVIGAILFPVDSEDSDETINE